MRPADHPRVPPARIGVVLSNLGTPDATDYWSMRRYLNEFLSDRRVIDYSPWLWQPLLQLVILTKRPFSSGEAYRGIWKSRGGREPAPDDDPRPGAGGGRAHGAAPRRPRVVDFAMRYGNPSTALGDRQAQGRRAASGSSSSRSTRSIPRPTTATACDQAFPHADGDELAAVAADRAGLLRPPALYRGAGAVGRADLRRARASAGRAGDELPRRAAALPARGRPLPLPVPEDDAAAARAARTSPRTRSSSPSSRSSARRNG